jgi:hypothetical protein
MMEQIDRDVMRTHPDMHFFSGDGEPSKRHREVCTHSSHAVVAQAINIATFVELLTDQAFT